MSMVIEMSNVSWKRQGQIILEQINWHVLKGEHWAILGLNGSGKTTLLQMINGYIWPTTGEISVLGQTFGTTDLRLLRKNIGWVSSALQQKIRLTDIAEAVILSGKHASIGIYEKIEAKDMARVDALMEQLGIRYLQGRSYQTMSQGEKQKLLIARGLMARPQLLILDEPTNGLDFLAREELLLFIQQLAEQKEAPTMLFVTHHIEEILPIFSYTLLLRQGTVFEQGKTGEIMCSKTLSQFYQLPIECEMKDGRTWVRKKTETSNDALANEEQTTVTQKTKI
ncbi:ABC transporter ATP-binding protein [Virgibacillus pantothenticus]|uniref:ABC transporter ATP-binding protein n=1 Tax=Virgibacillus TaxID=84406 RepID=UPI0009099F64|nr:MULTISPECIES: ABC transporter ATP-binding protein [Virgibacillus]API93250.1 molybdenum ABC transporter ATP-binding protein [Virgibacillus sp. 6R]MBS7428704.1 ABC transporter ATP-binding protein [Virgibacillus sp. 19R1-5]MBU8565767.1 ABC transporter ATP-binding protein [Virgibacillus pantothenticus]MBU8599646.1 ABC transporter ATP-binding protein [Virgibacillus pantothenticus]MBU8634093.1 ABC transporter ATP-binding protein [Virgibacillus pantothenticus]